MSEPEFAAYMEQLYGDPALRAADRPLLEGPDMLLPEPPAPAPARRPGAGAAAAAGGRGDALASRVMPQGAGAVTTTLVGGAGGGGARGGL
jgi:hypothetical protein